MVESCTIADCSKLGQRLVVATLAVAIVGTFGSLALSMVLGLKACPLCFYQRSFIMATASVLAVGLVSYGLSTSTLSLLALPLATCGLAVAGFHEFLERTGKLECPCGIFGLGTAPQQSLVLFMPLCGALLVAATTGT